MNRYDDFAVAYRVGLDWIEEWREHALTSTHLRYLLESKVAALRSGIACPDLSECSRLTLAGHLRAYRDALDALG